MFENITDAKMTLEHLEIQRERLQLQMEEAARDLKQTEDEFVTRAIQLNIREAELHLQQTEREIEMVLEFIEGHPHQELLLEG